MTSCVRKKGPPAWAGNWSRMAVAAVFGWSAAVAPALAQSPEAPAAATPAPAAEASPAPTQAPPLPAQVPAAAPELAPELYTLAELEFLLAPIALYPDPLLAILLPAAAFPDQIVAAYRWVERNPNTARHGDLSALDGKPWDSSVKALTRFPDVLKNLYKHMEWTESLGFAFIKQPQDVSNAIQMLRAQAEQVGNLATTPQQVVTTREDAGQRTIYIQPANPERVYVPVYNPNTAFNTFAAGALGFGAGVLVGSSWNNRWGWNNRGWNTIWVAPPAWHQPPHWGWGPGPRPRPPAWGPGPWHPRPPHSRPDAGRPGRPDRPAMRPPSRPGGGTWQGNRPGNRPIINRPEININQPGNSGIIINRPDNRPGTRPEINRPDVNRPGNRPDGRPGTRPEISRPDGRPGTRPEINRPNINRPDNRPGTRPEINRPNINRPEGRPGTRPEINRPNVNRPESRPGNTPNVNRPNVNRPSANRPENRPAANRPNVNRPNANRPNAGQNRPANRPNAQRQQPRANAPHHARPKQHARPQQRANPQQRARPQTNRRNNN
ncbi:DUF3300 domain-containing protein [Xanthobacter variabilis]|uniref:DUF3300 domain-containing protein n=1 Tax=Xanthobacter variabilis TaxID=3119932 RepID=UPI00374EB6D6